MNVPNMLHGVLIGAKGSNLSRIKQTTGCTVKPPPRHSNSDIVRINGSSRDAIERARVQIELSLEGKRFSKGATHFLSFRLSTPEIIESYEEFKDRVVKEFGVEPKIFQKNTKLHLTIGVLHLLSETEVKRATKILQETVNETIRDIFSDLEINEIPELEMNGVEIMNDDPYLTEVLYAKIMDQDEILQRISDAVFGEFVKADLAKNEFNRVKVHCTVMNSRFVSDESRSEKGQRRDRTKYSFDASKILKAFESFKFGSVKIDKIYLNERFRKSDDDYYYSVSTLEL